MTLSCKEPIECSLHIECHGKCGDDGIHVALINASLNTYTLNIKIKLFFLCSQGGDGEATAKA